MTRMSTRYTNKQQTTRNFSVAEFTLEKLRKLGSRPQTQKFEYHCLWNIEYARKELYAPLTYSLGMQSTVRSRFITGGLTCSSDEFVHVQWNIEKYFYPLTLKTSTSFFRSVNDSKSFIRYCRAWVSSY